MHLFDICIVTACDERQAETFRSLIRRRTDNGLYPREIDFRVYADPEGGRIGSGGGTLWVLLRLVEDLGIRDTQAFFAATKILIIHAGGESRRMPIYAPEGKLFAPVPAPSSSIFPPVVLDMQLALYLKYPWAEGEVIIASGDIIMDFDTESVPRERGSICGFAKPASFQQGARHGVFKLDARRKGVLDFFQKASPEFLAENACISGTDECALDTGMVSLGPDFVQALLSFADERLPGGETVAGGLRNGGVYLDVYLEFLTACLPGISWETFLERVALQTRVSEGILRTFYDVFSRFSLKGVVTRHTSFLHFGALHEFLEACTEMHSLNMLPFYASRKEEVWDQELRVRISDGVALYNSTSSTLRPVNGATVLGENLRDTVVKEAEGGNLFVGMRGCRVDEPVPHGICIDRRELADGAYAMVCSTGDTFKPMENLAAMRFCGVPLEDWLRERGIDVGDVLQEGDFDLFSARLFPANPAGADFVAGYWRTPSDLAAWRAAFLGAPRLSIRELNEQTDVNAREASRIEARKQEIRSLILRGKGWHLISAPDFQDVFSGTGDVTALHEQCEKTDDVLLRAYRRATISRCLPEPLPVETISFVGETSARQKLSMRIKEDQIVWARSPIRFDLAGGWSDTPPYTMRYGGRVVNLAVDLNGQPPVQVFCRRTSEFSIRIHSIDLGVTEEITTLEGIRDYRNPTSPFALPKAALCLLGLFEDDGTSLADHLRALGGGLEITLLCAVPKGSGLGTSSVLGATIIAALGRAFGIEVTTDELFLQVLDLEQMLTTGGGWQDQIGAMVGGVKCVESPAGMKPIPIIHQLDTALFEDRQHHECMTLFYTGITRLAKNILQDVVTGVNEATPAYLFTHDHLKELADQAKEAISLRDLPRLARVINGSWRAGKLLHSSTTNDQVEALLAETGSWWSGMKLPGAGGGGFALFISPDRAAADDLREVLVDRFEDDRARIVDFSLSTDGMRVSVS